VFPTCDALVGKAKAMRSASMNIATHKGHLWILLISLYSVACDGHDRKLAHLRHTAWTFKDGAPAEVYSLAQTPDGFLWLGTASGFFHLAGIRFQQYQPPSDPKFNRRRV
jgi:ligand-binding sensor domain-containing protein